MGTARSRNGEQSSAGRQFDTELTLYSNHIALGVTWSVVAVPRSRIVVASAAELPYLSTAPCASLPYFILTISLDPPNIFPTFFLRSDDACRLDHSAWGQGRAR